MNDEGRPKAPAHHVAADPSKPEGCRSLPAELRELAQWLGYRSEQRHGKTTKVPYRADGGGLAAVDNPATWGSFEKALAARDRGDVEGIGFVFTEDDPFVGIDLDDCFDRSGRPHAASTAIVERFGSYTETSPLGRGLHLIGRGRLTTSAHRTSSTGWGGHFEVYDRRRYFTMTGLHLPGTPATVEPRQGELDALVAELFPVRVERAASRPAAVVSLNDGDLLDRARRARNGARFCRLYDSGDLSGYDSQSEAELALCGMLAFWTAGDAARIDRLFRASALIRDKWDEGRHNASDPDATYGDLTIRLAVANCPAFYTPRGERLRSMLAARSETELETLTQRDGK